MRIWILFVLIMLAGLSIKTKYLKVTTAVLFLYMAVNILNNFRIYPLVDIVSISKIEPFVDESAFSPGDVISTHRRIYTERGNIAMRLIYSMLTGNPFFHTVLVVNYNNQKFVFNTLPDESDVNERKRYPNVEVVGSKSGWTFLLEPLHVFLSIENRYNSIIKVVSSGKSIDYKEDIVRGIENVHTSYIHCAYFIGKYLELDGIIRNKSLFSDLLFYHPGCYSDYFANQKYLKL